MTQMNIIASFLKDSMIKGQIFTCTDKSENECFERMLFGTNKLYAPAVMRVRKGDLLFLLNLDTDILYGVFRAASDASVNIDPEAWGGKYPYQVKVEPIGGRIIPLKNAKKLLKLLKIKRSCPINKKVTIKLFELFRPKDLQITEWYKLLNSNEIVSSEIQKEEPKSWELFADFSDLKRTDLEPEEELPSLEATTLWDFPKQSYGKTPKGDNKYPGVTPAGVIWNLVWRYTEPGDLVVDPMAGSGTTLDVCKEEGRRCICYDIAPQRLNIIQNDSRKIPLPDDYVDLVFVDSPYGDNIRYNDNPNCIGKISSETEKFYEELEKVIKECHRILKPGKVLGWLIGDQWVKGKFTPVGFKVYQILTKYFETLDIICVTRRGQASHTGLWFNRARRFNFFLRGFKYLFIMRKQSLEHDNSNRQRKIKWTYYERNMAGRNEI